VLPNPGYRSGEPLLTEIATFVRTQAEAVERCAAGAPFALVGYSSGGWVAHAVTSHLERLGIFPAALVLLDAQRGNRMHPRSWRALRRAWLTSFPSVPRLDHELTAFTAYLDLFEHWTPAMIATPILFLSPTEPVPERDGDDPPHPSDGYDWRMPWEQPHDLVEVPGNHFTIVERHADTTARAVHNWLAALPSVNGDASGGSPAFADPREPGP
jgi:thioesterase domain-containing protein